VLEHLEAFRTKILLHGIKVIEDALLLTQQYLGLGNVDSNDSSTLFYTQIKKFHFDSKVLSNEAMALITTLNCKLNYANVMISRSTDNGYENQIIHGMNTLASIVSSFQAGFSLLIVRFELIMKIRAMEMRYAAQHKLLVQSYLSEMNKLCIIFQPCMDLAKLIL